MTYIIRIPIEDESPRPESPGDGFPPLLLRRQMLWVIDWISGGDLIAHIAYCDLGKSTSAMINIVDGNWSVALLGGLGASKEVGPN